MKYDIFISYRREGGYDTAKHLNDLLVRDGYIVSFDIDTLRSGDFDTQLLERIDQCKDFILIVDQHCFDRTLNPNFNPKNDWLRCELAYALKKSKNVIPIFLSGVNGVPLNLPSDIAGVAKKNGPEYNRYHFNAFYEDLKKRFLTAKSNKKNIAYAMIIITIISLFLLLMIISNKKQFNNNNKDLNVTNSTLINHDSANRNKIMDDADNISSEQSNNHRYNTDLTIIEVGDYFYEDHSFSHNFYNDKKCIGVVFNREAPYYAQIIAMENYGSGNWTVYQKVKKNGVNYSLGKIKWRIPYFIEWETLLRNLAGVECKKRTEAPNIGTYEFDAQKALEGLNSYHLGFSDKGWYWADGEYMSQSGEDECWSISFVNSCLYPGTESEPYFRYVANIEE